jgi:hypothetical protein
MYWPVLALLGAALAVAAFTFWPSGDDDANVAAGDDATADQADADGATADDAATTDGAGDGAAGDGDTGSTDAATDSGGDSVLPVTYQQAEAAGTLGETTFLGECDEATGRVAIPTVYAAPCVAEPTGADRSRSVNVADDKIVIAVYHLESDLTAIVFQDDADTWRTMAAELNDLFANTYETWGREVEFVNFEASGGDEISARADAQRVANELGAFASINGPSTQPAYADELSALGVLCLLCGLGVPDSTFQEAAPYMWGPLQTPEQFLTALTPYVVNRLNNKPAAFAGDPAFQNQNRTFGVVHFEQDPPVYTEVRRQVEEDGQRLGWNAEMFLTYQLDAGELDVQARNTIARLKADNVTTVVFLGDPFFLTFLTQAATTQQYFPEWLITGTVFTDTTRWARGFDQQQWANAFGISSQGVPVLPQEREGWQVFEWYYGRAPGATRDAQLVFDLVHQLYLGIHLAGPELTPETFAAGMANYPVSGGSSVLPQISYGLGLFDEFDYQGYDDVAEIWWDPNATGPDENGNIGTGLYKYANSGVRLLPADMPTSDPDAFNDATSIVGFEAIPDDQRAPSYSAPTG